MEELDSRASLDRDSREEVELLAQSAIKIMNDEEFC